MLRASQAIRSDLAAVASLTYTSRPRLISHRAPKNSTAHFHTTTQRTLPLIHLVPPKQDSSARGSDSDTMAPNNVDFSKALGYEDPDQPVSWNRRDLLLYAVGIGAPESALDYVYEMTPGFRAFPTYPLVLALKGAYADTTVFSEMISSRGSVPGMPQLDPNTIVHGEQSIEIVDNIPHVSGEGWKLRKRVVAIHDKGNALITEAEMRLVSPVGRTHAIMRGATFYRGGGQGTGFSQSLAPKAPAGKVPEGAKPTHVQKDKTTPAQAAIYRLSGDYNPLHIDPVIGEKGGLGGCILHGLCSYGFAARAVLQSVVADDGKRGAPAAQLKLMSARFTSPVIAGQELETSVWHTGTKDGYTEVAFEQKVVGGKKSLGGGYALVRKVEAPGSSKL